VKIIKKIRALIFARGRLLCAASSVPGDEFIIHSTMRYNNMCPKRRWESFFTSGVYLAGFD
jgi:hypothetical protein